MQSRCIERGELWEGGNIVVNITSALEFSVHYREAKRLLE